jgi:uncharacterized protein YigA (DUF484 family)
VTAKQKTRSEPDIETLLGDEQVRDYLLSHGDFFERYPELLDELQISHSPGGAVSLVEKQVQVLRERNMEMRKRLNSLTSNARDNDRLYAHTRKLILALLDAQDLDQLCITFTSALREEFEAEFASLILFGDPKTASRHTRVESPERARAEIGALMKNSTPVCGTLRGEELSYLFLEAGRVGSAAVVPLYHGGELGVIAVGSEDPHHYGASTGTDFLEHIGEVICRLLPKLGLGPPEGQ